MINLLLLLVAMALFLPLSIIGFAWGLVRNWRNAWEYLRKVAIQIDCGGNQILASIMNDLLIKKHGYLFGKSGETISSALGKNVRLNTLTFLGRSLNWILDKLDKNHSIKSINDHI